MSRSTYLKLRTGKRPAFYISLVAVCCALLFSSCAPRPVEETVTTAANRSSALPAGAQTVAVTTNLPAHDADIEAAGDHVAEAITHLDGRKREGHEAALRALGQAEVSMNRALRKKVRDERASKALHAALKGLETAERAVQRGTSDFAAARQLVALNKNLDELALRYQTQSTELEADEQPQLP